MSINQTPSALDAAEPAPTGRPGPMAPANDADIPARLPRAAAQDRTAATEQFRRSLADAEQLLAYAADAGRFPPEADPNGHNLKHWVIDAIIDARTAVEGGGLTGGVAGGFWAAYAELSRMTRPVTAESLRASADRPLRKLMASVLALAAAVILGSMFLFIQAAVATQTTQLVEQQNAASLRLWSYVQLARSEGTAAQDGAPAPAAERGNNPAAARAFGAATGSIPAPATRITPDELFGEVVEFARRSFWLRQTAWRLNNVFLFPWFRVSEKDIGFDDSETEKLGPLDVSPEIRGMDEISKEALRQIVKYQKIRNFAQASQQTNTVFYAGITNYLLPAVYALLGAALYGLRRYSAQVRGKNYLKSAAHSARYFIALIAGIVVGLFGPLVPNSVPVPPLAVAFLVGYAVEAFFSRLDGFIERMRGTAAAAQAAPADKGDAQPAPATPAPA